MPEALLTAKQIQEEFGFSRSSLLRWQEQGRLKPTSVTPGGQRRYSRADIQTLTKPRPPLAVPILGKAHQIEKAGGEEVSLPASGKASNIYREMGVTGLRMWGGSIYEERLRELQGRAGRILLREMRLNDPVIAAMFFAVENAIKQAVWRAKPASEGEGDKAAARFLDECIHDMSFSWSEELSFALPFEQGFSLLEKVFKRRMGMHPKQKGLSASKYSDGKIGWRKWAPRPAESLAPGDEWIFDEAGGVQGIHQMPEAVLPGQGRLITIPIQKLLHFKTTSGPTNSPEAVPLHRAAYTSWWYTTNLQEIEGIGVERDLAGIPVVYLGHGTSKSGDNSDYEEAKKLVVNLRSDDQSGVVIPGPKMGLGADGEGWLVELLSSSGGRSHNTSEIIRRYDTRKALSILAQFIMLGIESTGSYALSRHQGDLWLMAVSAWLTSIADVINRFAVPELIDMNVFPGRTGYPELVPSPIDVPDMAGMATAVNLLVQAEVLKPDAEMERHIRQVMRLPPPVPVEVGANPLDQLGDAAAEGRTIDETALLLRRLMLVMESLQDAGTMTPEQMQELIAPLQAELEQALASENLKPNAPLSVAGRTPGAFPDRTRANNPRLKIAKANKKPGEWGRLELAARITHNYDNLKADLSKETTKVGERIGVFLDETTHDIEDVYRDVWKDTRGKGDDDVLLPVVLIAARNAGGYLQRFGAELQGEMWDMDAEERAELLEKRRARAVLYAGGAWALAQLAKIAGRPQEEMWAWFGGVSSASCEDCVREVSAGARPLNQITRFPGGVQCLTNCHHELVQVS